MWSSLVNDLLIIEGVLQQMIFLCLMVELSRPCNKHIPDHPRRLYHVQAGAPISCHVTDRVLEASSSAGPLLDLFLRPALCELSRPSL